MAIRNFKLLLLIAAVFYFEKSLAQTESLNIGDKIPDISLGKFLDDPQKTMKTSDLKGKLVILDFWNNRCSVCLTGMPKMDSLQKKFGERLQIIAVTYNNEEEVKTLFKKIKIKKPDLPFIVRDTVFNSLFPHNGDPLHVWINPEGVISAITFHYNTNDETVSKFLNGVDPKLTRRWDFGFDSEYPIVSEKNSGLLGLGTNYSILLQGTSEYSDSQYEWTRDNYIKLFNRRLLYLYQIAYGNQLYGFNVNHLSLESTNRLIFETKNKDRFIPPTEEKYFSEWTMKNVFSYELKVPDEKASEKFQRMQEDLDRYFPFKASIEKRKVRCLTLSRINPTISLKAKNPTMSFDTLIAGRSLTLQNKPVITFISYLLYSNSRHPIPIVDGTNITYNIDLKLEARLSDLDAVNQELKSFGLALVEKEMSIGMLVIRDK